MIHPIKFAKIRQTYNEIVNHHDAYVKDKEANLFDWQKLQESRQQLIEECIEFLSRTNEKIDIHGGEMKTQEIDTEYKQYLENVESFKAEYNKDLNDILKNTKLTVVTRVTTPGK